VSLTAIAGASIVPDTEFARDAALAANGSERTSTATLVLSTSRMPRTPTSPARYPAVPSMNRTDMWRERTAVAAAPSERSRMRRWRVRFGVGVACGRRLMCPNPGGSSLLNTATLWPV
jgi:hypothetical protein